MDGQPPTRAVRRLPSRNGDPTPILAPSPIGFPRGKGRATRTRSREAHGAKLGEPNRRRQLAGRPRQTIRDHVVVCLTPELAGAVRCPQDLVELVRHRLDRHLVPLSRNLSVPSSRSTSRQRSRLAETRRGPRYARTDMQRNSCQSLAAPSIRSTSAGVTITTSRSSGRGRRGLGIRTIGLASISPSR